MRGLLPNGALRLLSTTRPNPIDMHDRSERQVTHPWLARQRTPKLELPPGAEAPVSAARLALESAFDEVRTSEAHSQARTAAHTPAVVVKRKRTLAPPAVVGLVDASRGQHDTQADAAEGGRAPRVFRVDAAPVVQATAPAVEPASVSKLGDEITDDTWIEPIPLIAARRPRRRAAPAIVTTVVQESPEPAVRYVVANEADELLGRLAALEATFSVIRQAQSFSATELRNRRRYVALMAEIERLRTVAEAARSAETAKAISGIKRDIKKYGLRRDDLGL